jgi:hypothetical protein
MAPARCPFFFARPPRTAPAPGEEFVPMQSILWTVDRLSTWIGKVFRLVRPPAHAADQLGGVFALRAQRPHAWVLDAQIMLYGTMFMTAGAYTLSKNGHVRGDVLYGFFHAAHPGAPSTWCSTSSSSCPASSR